MIYLIGGLSIFVLVGCIVWWYAKKPYKHKSISQEGLKKFLDVLLFRGYDRGFICIEIPSSDKFIQFSKYVKRANSVGLELDFPLAEWSKDYYEPLKNALNEKGFKYEIQMTGQKGLPEFIVVDLEQDTHLALNLTRIILIEVFGLRADDTVDLYFKNVSPRDERIGL